MALSKIIFCESGSNQPLKSGQVKKDLAINSFSQ